jgi:hypothetical protein
MAVGNKNRNLAELREEIRQLWPEANYQHRAERQILIPPLLAELAPEANLAGQLLEICGEQSSGKTSFLYSLLADFDKQTTVAYFDLSGSFYPGAALREKSNRDELLLIRHDNSTEALCVAEQILTNGLAQCLVFDLAGCKDQLPHILLHRLRQQLNRSNALAIFLTLPAPWLLPNSSVSMRLSVNRRDDSRICATVERSRLSPEGAKLEVNLGS